MPSQSSSQSSLQSSSQSSLPSSSRASLPSRSAPPPDPAFEHDPGATWFGPCFQDPITPADLGDELEASSYPSYPSFPSSQSSPSFPSSPSSSSSFEQVTLQLRRRRPPARRPPPRGWPMALVVVAVLALTLATALSSHYLFMYLFTGHW